MKRIRRICALLLTYVLILSSSINAAATETDFAAQTEAVILETLSEEPDSSSKEDLSDETAVTEEEDAKQTEEEVSFEEEAIEETSEEDESEIVENLTLEDQLTVQEDDTPLEEDAVEEKTAFEEDVVEEETSSEDADEEETVSEEETLINLFSLEEDISAAVAATAADALEEDETEEEITRYFRFDIDKSGVMWGTRLEETREAVYKLCEDILSMDGNNYISIACNGGGIDFTDDLEALLDTSILSYKGDEYLYDTLEGSYNKLNSIDDGEKYLIVFDQVDSGYGSSSSGPYAKYRDQHQISYSQVYTYNSLYYLAEEIKESGISLYIVSSAVDSHGNVSKSNGLLTPHKVADDMANEGCYYCIEDGSALNISFEENPSDPIEVIYETTEIESDESAAVYEICATVTNTLEDTTLSDVFVSLGVCSSFNESALAYKGTYYPSTILTDYGERDQEIETLAPLESVDITWRVSFDLTLSDVYEEDLTYYFSIAALCDQTSVTVVAGEVNPDRICLDCEISSEEVSYTNLTSIYQITATLTNKSDVDTLTNVYAALDLDDGGDIWTEYGEQIQTLDELSPGESTEITWYITIDNTEYADGGSFYYYVEAGSDESNILLEEGVIELDAINGESNELDYDVDVWSFQNFEEVDGHTLITGNYLEALLDGLETSEQERIKKKIAQNIGHCYGMSSTVILNKMNVEDITSYTGTDTLYEAELDENETNIIICYYQLTQFTDLVQSAGFEFKEGYSVQEQLEILWEKASAVSEGGTPALFIYEHGEYGEYEGAGHAVVAFGTEEGSFTSSTTGKTYNRRVLLYDSNSMGYSDDFIPKHTAVFKNSYCLLYNEGTDEWEIPAYVDRGVYSESGVAELDLCTTDLSVINSQDFTTHSFNIMSIRNKITFKLMSGSSSWLIYGNTDVIEGDSALSRYYSFGDDVNGSGVLNILLPDDSDDFSLVTESGDAEEILIDITYDGRYIWIEADAAEGVEFSEAGSITLLGNEGDFEVLIADDSVEDGEFDVFTVTGDTEGDIVITLTDDSILVEGDTTDGITIEASEGDVTDTLTVNADVESVEFGRNEDDNLYCKSHVEGEAVQENIVEATCSEEGSCDEVTYCVICGYEISRETITLEKTDHTEGSAVIENSVDPDCTAAGSYDTVIYCSVCGEELSRETTYIDATGHSAGEAVIENRIEPTCTEDGSYEAVFYCTVCDEKIDSVSVILPATGHTQTDAVRENATAATCTEDGSYDEVVYCSVCGEEISRETIAVPATGHTVGEAVIENVVEAACEENGSYDTVTYCSVCGEEIDRTTTIIEALGHTAGEVVIENEKDPTCTVSGSYDEVIYCSVCGKEVSRETVTIPATGHTPGEIVIENLVAATCESIGSYDEVVYCSVCGEEISRTEYQYGPTDHEEADPVLVSYTAPTCTETGLYVIEIRCTLCGEVIETIYESIDPTGHTEGTPVIENLTESSCMENGSYDLVYYCSVCGEEISRSTIILGLNDHIASTPVIENMVSPTCEEEGSYDLVTYCSVCGKELSREAQTLEATGHIALEAVKENIIEATCEEDGSYDYVVYCSVCGKEISRETKVIEATGHTASDASVENYIDATCTEDGSYDLVVCCSVCGKELSRKTQVIEATGHNFENGICTNCGAKEASTDDSGEADNSGDTGDASSADSESGSSDSDSGTSSGSSSSGSSSESNSSEDFSESEYFYTIREPIPEDLGRLLDITDSTVNAYGARITNTEEELKTLVLTEEERTLIYNGAVIRLELRVKDYTTMPEMIPQEDRTLIENTKGDAQIGLYLGIELYKQVGEEEPVAITKTNAPIGITLTLPESLENSDGKADRTFQVMRIHDGEADLLACTYDESQGTISFESDRFSTYAVLYEDESTNEISAFSREAASTGDRASMLLWLILMIGSAGGLLVFSFISRRRIK